MTLTTEMLLEKLNTLEPIVAELLSKRDLNMMMKEKILKLEELISEITDDNEEAADEWRRKLASLWMQYARLLDGTMPSNELLEKTGLKSWKGDASNDAKLLRFLRLGGYPTPKKARKLKHPNVFKMEKQFEALRCVKDMADFDGMKRWLNAVVKAFWLVPPQLPNIRVQKEAFNLAISKLPPEALEMFEILYEEKSLYNIFDFIRLEVENYSENHRLQAPNHGLSGHDMVKLEKESRDERGNPISDCKSCHAKDHTIKTCPTVKLSFCLSCFRYGHMDNVCYRIKLFTHKPAVH